MSNIIKMTEQNSNDVGDVEVDAFGSSGYVKLKFN